MVSRENAVIVTCIALTVAAWVGLDAAGITYPSWISYALFIGGGVVVPTAINELLGGPEHS